VISHGAKLNSLPQNRIEQPQASAPPRRETPEIRTNPQAWDADVRLAVHKSFAICYQSESGARLEGARALSCISRPGVAASLMVPNCGVFTKRSACQVSVVEGVEKFGAKLESCASEVEDAGEREIQSLYAWAVYGVCVPTCRGNAAGVAKAAGLNHCAPVCVPEGKIGWPVRLARRIFAEDGACVGGVTENGDGQRKPLLDLVDRDRCQSRVTRSSTRICLSEEDRRQRWCQAITHVAGRPFPR